MGASARKCRIVVDAGLTGLAESLALRTGLEPTKRGPDAGVVGYVDFSGNLDTAIAIRMMVWRHGRASVQAGAGIVADSDPADEDLEMPQQGAALLTAAAASRRLAPLGTLGAP